MRPRLLALCLLALPAACATTGAAARPGESAADAAERAYQSALSLYNDESWPEAQEAFRAIQRHVLSADEDAIHLQSHLNCKINRISRAQDVRDIDTFA